MHMYYKKYHILWNTTVTFLPYCIISRAMTVVVTFVIIHHLWWRVEKYYRWLKTQFFYMTKCKRKLIHKSNNSLHQDKQSMLDNIKMQIRLYYYIGMVTTSDTQLHPILVHDNALFWQHCCGSGRTRADSTSDQALPYVCLACHHLQ